MPETKHIIQQLKNKSVGTILTDEPLATHSTWKIGGVADIFVLPAHPEGLRQTLQTARECSIPVVIIGGGSNLLFDDAGVRGIVIKIDSGLSDIAIDKNIIKAGAGVWVPCLARAAGKAGLTGLEHIIGIPGTFGGLLFMNGGSQRKSIGDCVRKVCVMDRNGKQLEFSPQDCQFAYRQSLFQHTDLIILGAELECLPGDSEKIHQDMLSILRDRSNKFPRKSPNCGSVFVSDPAMYKTFGSPGHVIEECSLKGIKVGDASVSTQHANFIINSGMATSAQVMKLINNIRHRVHERTGYWLHCEVRYVHPSGLIKPLHEFFVRLPN